LNNPIFSHPVEVEPTAAAGDDASAPVENPAFSDHESTTNAQSRPADRS
jgi:hypothetical protein